MTTSEESREIELLYPFYLDTDMTMAFAAALTGGVALESEQVDQAQHEDQNVRKLKAGLRIFDVLDLGGGKENQNTESVHSESRVVRRHTEASIFINLIDELRQRGMIIDSQDLNVLSIGQIVSIEVGPAMAPLLRVVDQILRLLEVTSPEPEQAPKQVKPAGSGQAKKPGRITPPNARSVPAEEDSVDSIRTLFRSLKGDLDFSGMTDIVVQRTDGPNVLLTLDNRFITDQALELLHTSTFRVIGKITQIWSDDTEVVNLYRRSVLSLVPSLPFAMGFLVMGMLGGMAAAIDVNKIQRETNEALGLETPEQQPQELLIGNDFYAMLPGIMGPAVQILPLAVCA